MHKQALGGSIYSGLQKGLHDGQKAVEFGPPYGCGTVSIRRSISRLLSSSTHASRSSATNGDIQSSSLTWMVWSWLIVPVQQGGSLIADLLPAVEPQDTFLDRQVRLTLELTVGAAGLGTE